jgi:hypothetical protein
MTPRPLAASEAAAVSPVGVGTDNRHVDRVGGHVNILFPDTFRAEVSSAAGYSWLELSGPQIQQRFAAAHIDRHRDLVVHDEPIPVDLPEAARPPNPGIGPVPVLQRAADPIEAVPERHILAQGNREVVNLVAERTLVYRKDVCPVLPFSLCSRVLQRRYNEGYAKLSLKK